MVRSDPMRDRTAITAVVAAVAVELATHDDRVTTDQGPISVDTTTSPTAQRSPPGLTGQRTAPTPPRRHRRVLSRISRRHRAQPAVTVMSDLELHPATLSPPPPRRLTRRADRRPRVAKRPTRTQQRQAALPHLHGMSYQQHSPIGERCLDRMNPQACKRQVRHVLPILVGWLGSGNEVRHLGSIRISRHRLARPPRPGGSRGGAAGSW